MKTIRLEASTRVSDISRELSAVLDKGGVVCVPCTGRYRVMADLTNPAAVMKLMQSKRRMRPAPALAFIDGEEMLRRVAGQLHPLALELARRYWPLPLTIRVPPSEALPEAVLKQLGGAKARLGVRVPGDAVVREVISLLGRPLLVSSANPERRSGAGSPAQVRKNFLRGVDLFLERGDLPEEAPSTVIDVVDGQVVIERPGAITAQMLSARG